MTANPVTPTVPIRRVFSIRWIVTGAAVALTAGSVLAVGAFAERDVRETLTRELQHRLVLEARNLALASSGALLSDFPELTLSPILSKMKEDDAQLAWAVVVDLEGAIRGHADARRIAEAFELPATLQPRDPGETLSEFEEVLEDETLLVAATPVNRRSGDRIGTAYVALQRGYVDTTISEARRRQLAAVAILVVGASVIALVLVSLLLRPVGVLHAGLQRIGRGDLDTPVELKDRTEFGLLAQTMNEMSTRLKAAQEEHVEKERLAREVELAREIQTSLLPSEGSRFGACSIDGSQRAAAEVGGDYWDVFPLTDGRVGIAVADVSGKGLAGCLVTSMLAALLRAFRESEESPRALLVRLEQQLQQSLRPGTFITMFYGILDPGTGVLRFASAGHSPLLVWRTREKRAEWFRTTGIPLGAVRGGALARTLRDETVQLRAKDLVLQFTDGINEAFDESGSEQFGFGRIEQCVAAHAEAGCRAVIDTISASVKDWAGDQPPLDDETLVAVSVDATLAPVPGSGQASDPVALVHEARRSGVHLRLPGNVQALTSLPRWIEALPGADRLGPREKTVLESALYEVAANIAEHGLDNNAAMAFDLWWMPGPAARREQGLFLFLDRGRAFQPDLNHSLDFADAAVRRKGRGIGLEIIRKATRDVAYHPQTAEGNVTLLQFDLAPRGALEGATHE